MMSVNGMTSGHLVNLSMQVSRYICPLEGGSDPTKSMWMESNLALGGVKVESWVTECLLMAVDASLRPSLVMFGQTNPAITNF